MNKQAGLSLNDQLRTLESVQEVDLKIDQLKKEKTAIPATLKALEDAVAKARAVLQVKKNEIAEFDKIRKQTRAAMELNTDRLSRSGSRADGVKNTQEYNAVSKEIEQLTKMNATLEEQLKKIDGDVALVEAAMKPLDEALNKAITDLEATTQSLGGQGQTLDQHISELASERSVFTAKIEKRVMAIYDRVRSVKGGLGISHAIAGRCKSCNMVVPPQLYNELQKGLELHSCPSCHRVLFAKN